MVPNTSNTQLINTAQHAASTGSVTINGIEYQPVNPGQPRAPGIQDMRQATTYTGRAMGGVTWFMKNPIMARMSHATALGAYTGVTGYNVIRAYLDPIKTGLRQASPDINTLTDKVSNALNSSADLLKMLDINQIQGLITNLSSLASNATGDVAGSLNALVGKLSVLHDTVVQTGLNTLGETLLKGSDSLCSTATFTRDLATNQVCIEAETIIQELAYGGLTKPVGNEMANQLITNTVKDLVGKLQPAMGEGIQDATAVIQEAITQVQNQLLAFTGQVGLESVQGNLATLNEQFQGLNQTFTNLVNTASDTLETLENSSSWGNIIAAIAIGVLGVSITLNIYSQYAEKMLQDVGSQLPHHDKTPSDLMKKSIRWANFLGTHTMAAVGSAMIWHAFSDLTKVGGTPPSATITGLQIFGSMAITAAGPFVSVGIASALIAAKEGFAPNTAQPAALDLEMG